MRRLAHLSVLFLSAAAAAACGPETADGPHGKDRSDLAEVVPGPGVPDMAGADTTCGGQQFQVERVQPNVFLVIDRSGSMGNAISGTSTTTKWEDLKGALGTLVTGFDSQIRLGLSLYNRDGDCAAGEVDTALGPLMGSNITSQLAATPTGGNTPTAATLDYVRTHGGLNDTTRQNVVVLATDGIPNCGDTDVAGKITALYNMNPPVSTFVIGVGSETASNPALLNSWAVAGHTARTGTTKYYQSNSATELQTAFQSIVNGVVSCTFQLSSVPPDPSQLYVWLGGTQVALDAGNGYTYVDSPTQITLNGQACDALKADPSKMLQIVYGCPTPPAIL